MKNTRLSTTNDTTFITLMNDVYISKSLELYGEWSFGEIECLSKFLKPTDNIVEVGSNIGSHTVFIARDLVPNGNVYAFEPRRQLFQLLCGNLALNGIENVFSYQCALGKTAETFSEGKLELGNALNAGGYALGSIPGNTETFDIRPIDDFLDTLQPITVLKADVEGHELDLLVGGEKLIKRDRPIMYLENDKSEKSKDLIELIWKLNYNIWWHKVPLFNPKNKALTQQNIFQNIVSLNIICIPSERNINIEGLEIINESGAHPAKKPHEDRKP